jgi:DNA-binding phage protein
MTPATKTRILAVIRKTGNMTKAAEAAGISRQTLYNHMYEPEFKKAVQKAKSDYMIKLCEF